MFRTSLLLLICLFSCSRMMEIELPQNQKLVVHGYVAVGEKFSVTIARTVNNQSDDTLRHIKNAWVALYENDIFIDSLLFNPLEKKYIARQAIAEYGKIYSIKAGAPAYPTIEATATAPAAVPTISLSHIKNARLDDNGGYLDDVQFSFQDPAGTMNYYVAALYASKYGIRLLCAYSADPAIDRQMADLLPTGEGKCINPRVILFNDKSFNGSLKKITLSAWPKGMETVMSSGEQHKPYLKRYAISETCYKYLKNIQSQDFELGLPNISVQATNVGNITNGYGLFTLYSETTDSIP